MGGRVEWTVGWTIAPDCPLPLLFVSVASKGFSQTVSLVFATLTERCISVAAKGLKAMVGSGPDGVGARGKGDHQVRK
jgi:hypothetical protein